MRMLPLIESRLFAPPRFLRAFPDGELERLFELPFGGPASVPPVALYSREDGLLLRSPLPGLDASQLELEVDGDALTISGEWPVEPASEDTLARRTERPRGRFTRTLRLHFEVESSKVQARLERGVLEVELPRAEASRPIKTQIRSQSQTQED